MEEPRINNFQYNDLLFRIVLSLIAAHLVVSFGAKESLFQLFLMWDYWRSLLLSCIIAFILITMVYMVTVRLDKHFDWIEYPVQRIGFQVIAGIGIPSVAAFLLAAVYFRTYGKNILDTGYLRFDFPVIALLLLLLNLYYLVFYFYKSRRLPKVIPDASKTANLQKSKEVFIVQKGAKNIPLLIDTISYFYHEGTFNFVRTSDREDFVISQALDEVEQLLPDKQFFRANRQMLVNFSACEHFEPLEFGKLELFVIPPTKEPIIISQKRAKAFKEWIER